MPHDTIRVFFVRTCVCALCICCLWESSHAGIDVYYSLGTDITYDTNLPQNITAYADWYAAPALYVKLSGSGKRNPFSLWASSNYENHLRERSATLSTPFLHAGFSLEFQPGLWELDFDGSYAAYAYRTWEIARNRMEAEMEMVRFVKQHELGLKLTGMYNDYGDDDDDGIRARGRFEYIYDFRVLKSQTLAIRDYGAFISGEINEARSDSSDYLDIEAGIGAEIKLGLFSLELGGAVSRREYGGVRKHPEGFLVSPRNRYYKGDIELEIPMPWELDLDIGTRLRFKDSTYPSYDYDYHSVYSQLTWRSSFRMF